MASSRRFSKPGPVRATVVWTAASAAAATGAVLAAPAGAEPHDPTMGHPAARTAVDRIDHLYEQAERATERSNAASTRTHRLRRQVDRLQDRAARGQERVNRMRVALGAIAGGQYRTGGFDPGLALLLSSDPADYLDQATMLDRISSRQAGQLRVLARAQRTLGQQRTEAAAQLVKLEHGCRAVALHKREVQRKLATARRLLGAMRPGEWEAYAHASRASRAGDGRGHGAYAVPGAGAYAVPGAPSGTPHATTGPGPSSPRAAAAFGAARAAVGLPYAWGQAGPTAFDCSGLTQWAYRRAGVAIPRTSQAQARTGQPLVLSQARPGDLVVYRSDAGHVAMYAGGGQVIHAPYPGATVRYDPVGMMPIFSITRV